MLINAKKTKKKYTFLAIILFLAVFVPINQANAAWYNPFSWSFSGIIEYYTGALVDATVGELINAFLLFFINVIGSAIEWSARLLDGFISFQTNNAIYNIALVSGSWTIIRNFVNLFFILVLIIMAFGTIFNFPNYTWKQMLAPFLIAALLINFSLAIGVYIISVSNGLSSIFLREIQRAATGGISATFAQGADIAGGITISTAAGTFVQAVFSLVFLGIFLLAMISTAIFSLVRIFALWFLLILSPIAWFGYALPNLRKNTWSKWWEHFLCWCFWLPYFLFFVMFAVIFINSKSTLPMPEGFMSTVGNSVGFFVLSIMFLLGGMALARKWACDSGSYVKSTFGRIETGVRRYAPGAAYVRARYAGVSEGLKERGREIEERGLGIPGFRGAQAERLKAAEVRGRIAAIPGPGRVPGAKEEIYRAQAAEVDKEVKRLQLLNPTLKDLGDKLKSITASDIEKTAALKIKAENGWLETTDVDRVAKAVRDAGGGKTALGASIIASLKKGGFHEMAASTAEKEAAFNKFIKEDTELAKVFGLSMAESRDVFSQNIAEKILSVYEGDTKEAQDKIAKALGDNIENIARNKSDREAIINTAITPATTKAQKSFMALTAKTMVNNKEVDNWSTRRRVLELNGGVDAATGDPRTGEGRNLAKEIRDGNMIFKAEKDYRDSHAINHAIDLNPVQRTDVQHQMEADITAGLIKGLSAEEMKTPEIFNAINTVGATIPPPKLAKFRQEMMGKKPDRKKREAFDKALAGPPIPY